MKSAKKPFTVHYPLTEFLELLNEVRKEMIHFSPFFFGFSEAVQPAQQAAAELRRAQAYLESQGSLLGGEALQQQAAVWQSKLGSTQIGPDEALLLVETIKAGPWTEEQQRGLAMLVNSAVLQSTTPANHRRDLQEISDFSRYLSSNDKKARADPAISGARKMEQVACRLKRLGIHTASELALRHIFSIALKAGLQRSQDPDSLSLSFNELKRIVKQTCKGAPRMREHLTKYPIVPVNFPSGSLMRHTTKKIGLRHWLCPRLKLQVKLL